mmetsp:Transcript_9554/g.21153  ORF Transcript_9554/g.21153 Transcript_9554/m.21153 type:complete len:248 (-) Transcript_9554:289-1032(-)
MRLTFSTSLVRLRKRFRKRVPESPSTHRSSSLASSGSVARSRRESPSSSPSSPASSASPVSPVSSTPSLPLGAGSSAPSPLSLLVHAAAQHRRPAIISCSGCTGTDAGTDADAPSLLPLQLSLCPKRPLSNAPAFAAALALNCALSTPCLSRPSAATCNQWACSDAGCVWGCVDTCVAVAVPVAAIPAIPAVFAEPIVPAVAVAADGSKSTAPSLGLAESPSRVDSATPAPAPSAVNGAGAFPFAAE